MKVNNLKKVFFSSNSTKLVAYIVTLFLFFSYLIFATDIVSFIMQNSVKKTNVNISRLKNDAVVYSIDHIEYFDDFCGSIQLSGWAFCETQGNNAQKEVWSVFKSEKSTYVFKNELQPSEINSILGSIYSIRGNNHRFGDTISTAVMENGLYKILIYCKENNNNYGLVDTGKMIKKDSNGISEYIWQSSPSNVTETEIEGKTKCTIDFANISDGEYLQITGWAFIEGQNTENQSVYVRLLDENCGSTTYSTQNISRVDVGKAFKSNLYNNSGFKMTIPKNTLKDGNIKVEVLVKNGVDVYLAENTYEYILKDDAMTLLKVKLRKKSNLEIKVDPKIVEEDVKVKYNVDSYLFDEFLNINGWAFIYDKESSEVKVYLAIISANGTTHVFQTDKYSRPDVAKAFKSEFYTESGFSAAIPLEAITDGKNEIIVIVDNGQMLKATKSYTLQYSTEDN